MRMGWCACVGGWVSGGIGVGVREFAPVGVQLIGHRISEDIAANRAEHRCGMEIASAQSSAPLCADLDRNEHLTMATRAPGHAEVAQKWAETRTSPKRNSAEMDRSEHPAMATRAPGNAERDRNLPKPTSPRCRHLGQWLRLAEEHANTAPPK